MDWDYVRIVGIPNLGTQKLPDSPNWDNPNWPYVINAFDQAFVVEGCYERFKGQAARPMPFVQGDEQISNAMRSNNMNHACQAIRSQILGLSWIDPTKPRDDKGSYVGPTSYNDLLIRTPNVTNDDVASTASGCPPTKEALIHMYKDLKQMSRRSFMFGIDTDNLEQQHSNQIHPRPEVEGCPWAYCNNKAGRSDFQDSGYFKRTSAPGIKLANLDIETDRIYSNIKACCRYSVAVYATDETYPMVLGFYYLATWVDGTLGFDRVTGNYYAAIDESAYSTQTCQGIVDQAFHGLGQMSNYKSDDGHVYDQTTVRCEFGISDLHMDYKIKTIL